MDELEPSAFERDEFCFACGQQNADGLRLQPEASPGRAIVRWTPAAHFQGYAGVLHGGIISTILDETMAHAALTVAKHAATVDLSLQFLKPVRTLRELEVRATVREQRRRILIVDAEVVQDGQIRARGEGRFLMLKSGMPS